MRVLDDAAVGERLRPTPRAATTETSRSKSTNASRSAPPPAAPRPKAPSLGRRADLRLPLAVVAEGRRLQHRRRSSGAQRRADLAVRTARNGRDGNPARRKVFSRRRCWSLQHAARPAGRARTPPRPRRWPRARSRTRTSPPRRRGRTPGRRPGRHRRPDLHVRHLAGGVSLSGEKVHAVAHRRAAMANMRPSWPLPRTPTAKPGRIGSMGGRV